MQASNTLSLRFLCIGVEPNFIAYLLTTAKPLNLSLDTCKTALDAEAKISSSAYDVYVIDLSLSKPVVLKLVQDIRKKGGNVSSPSFRKLVMTAISMRSKKSKRLTSSSKSPSIRSKSTFCLQSSITAVPPRSLSRLQIACRASKTTTKKRSLTKLKP